MSVSFLLGLFLICDYFFTDGYFPFLFRTFATQKTIIMETFYQVLAVIIGPVVGILVYGLIESKRNTKTKVKAANEADAMLDDTSYIQDMKHLYGNVGITFWQQYDIMLATQPYGWETMVDWAAYMESADFDEIDSIIVADMNEDNGIELAHVYNQNKVGLKNYERLKEECGMLSIAGHSRTLNDSVKIVWGTRREY